MAIDPYIAHGYRGGNANAFYQARDEAQQRQQHDAEDAAWQQAVDSQDIDTMARIDPHATQVLVQHWQEQKGVGLGIAPITADRMTVPNIPALPAAIQEFNYRKSHPDFAAYQDRPSPRQPSEAPADIRVANWYASATPAQRAAYDATHGGKPNPVPGPGEVAPTGGVPGFGTMPPGTKITEVQGKNYIGTSILAENIPVLASALKAGYVPSRKDLFAVGPPLKGVANTIAQELTPREQANPNANAFFNAGSKILTAILRPESGGAITEDEWTMYGPMYLPWPGDSKEDVARKMTSLNAYMKRLAQVSGPASGYFNGVPEEKIIDLPTPRK